MALCAVNCPLTPGRPVNVHDPLTTWSGPSCPLNDEMPARPMLLLGTIRHCQVSAPPTARPTALPASLGPARAGQLIAVLLEIADGSDERGRIAADHVTAHAPFAGQVDAVGARRRTGEKERRSERPGEFRTDVHARDPQRAVSDDPSIDSGAARFLSRDRPLELVEPGLYDRAANERHGSPSGHERRNRNSRQGDSATPGRVRQRERPIESGARRLPRGLFSRSRRADDPRAQRRRRQGGAAGDDRADGRRRRRPLRPHRRRAGRGADLERRSFRFARNRRAPLWPRRLRHEGLRRRRAGDGPRLSGGRAQTPDPHPTQLRRGNDLPRLARLHRAVRAGDAASGAGDRRRADDDDGRRRAQGRGDVSHPGHRLRGPLGQARARRQRGGDRLRHRQRNRPSGARLRGAREARSAIRSALFDLARRHDPWRNRAQHPGARMRVPLGVPRPAGRRHRHRGGDGAGLRRRSRAAAADPLRQRAEHRDDDGSRRARTRRRKAPTTAATLALRLTRSNHHRSPCPSPPKPDISSAPACRPSSAAPARSIRPTSPTNSSPPRNFRPASPSCADWRTSYRAEGEAAFAAAIASTKRRKR